MAIAIDFIEDFKCPLVAVHGARFALKENSSLVLQGTPNETLPGATTWEEVFRSVCIGCAANIVSCTPEPVYGSRENWDRGFNIPLRNRSLELSAYI
ncbi:MAG TPA: hypothetical protein VJ455_03600 [Ignavibacteria bacterium]|nr:hypothetical protein [Ignavibacteria bacterium]HLD03749.1 hypothetical protein [Candidatus Dojkabacteria bacterium]